MGAVTEAVLLVVARWSFPTEESAASTSLTRCRTRLVVFFTKSWYVLLPSSDASELSLRPQEQQTVSIAKAGIITTLNARTSILAAANPVGSKYNLSWPITRNIDLPPTLISRFDLLYLVLDKIDEVNDRRLARHLVSLYLEDRPATGGTDIMVRPFLLPSFCELTFSRWQKIEDLSAYISWARNHIHPVLTAEAGDALVKAYVEMRNVGADARSNDRRITATTRQLESMIRLSEAHARMRYSLHVEVRCRRFRSCGSGLMRRFDRHRMSPRPVDSFARRSRSPPCVLLVVRFFAR